MKKCDFIDESIGEAPGSSPPLRSTRYKAPCHAILVLLRSAYDRETPVDAAQWHHWNVFFPVRTITGEWTNFDVWRRLRDARWQYRKYTQTLEEWLDRQW